MTTDGLPSVWLDPPPAIETDWFPAEAHYDVVVVGAGLTGLSTALLLAQAGRQVAVLEARSVGAVTTGHSTAKATLLQATQLSKITSSHSQHVAGAYVEGNREGQQWLQTYCQDHGIHLEQRDAYTYAGTQGGASAVRREFDIARRLGLPVQMTDASELPYPSYGAVCLPDQLQFNPVDVLASLVAELRAAGGLVIQEARVTGVSTGRSCELVTSAGRSPLTMSCLLPASRSWTVACTSPRSARNARTRSDFVCPPRFRGECTSRRTSRLDRCVRHNIRARSCFSRWKRPSGRPSAEEPLESG